MYLVGEILHIPIIIFEISVAEINLCFPSLQTDLKFGYHAVRTVMGGGEEKLYIYMYTHTHTHMHAHTHTWGTRWLSCLRHCAASRRVAGSIPDDVIGIFH